MNKSLDYRKDERSLSKFEQDIKQKTDREAFLVEIFREEMKKRGHKVRISNNGVDNKGELVKKSDCRPDYKIKIDKETSLYEVKCGPIDHKWTFKIYDLEQYVKQEANILLFYGVGFDKDPHKINLRYGKWGIITPEKIQLMLNTYTPYQDSKWGNKFCIQVPKKDFDLYMESNEITVIEKETK